MRVAFDAMGVRIAGRNLVGPVSFVAETGEFVALVGPNGSGKSTILKTLYRAMQATTGTVRLGSDLLAELSPRAAAQRLAVLTQEHGSDFDFTVLDVVSAGLTPRKRMFQTDTREDRDLIAGTLARVGMAEHAQRSFCTLSGGEKQRVMLAAALVQQPRVLILDEPTNHLDIATQLEVLDLVASLGITVLAALHDLNLAAAYCDRVYMIKNGLLVGGGTPAEVFRSELVAEVFGVAVRIGENPATGRTHLFFSSSPN